MKKELFAGVLLLVLIGLCAWNPRFLSRMCTQLDEAVAPAGASTASWVALEVKVADGWVAYVRPPSVVMTLWMRT